MDRHSSIASVSILFAGAIVGNVVAHFINRSLYGYEGLFLTFALISLAAASISRLDALISFASFAGVGFAFEYVGVKTGLPFGRYIYLMPGQYVAGVPLAVILAWGSFGYLAYVSADSLTGGGKARTVVLASALMVILDLALDPIMVSQHAWTWLSRTELSWYGIPWTNFLGWFVVSAIAGSITVAVRPASGGQRTRIWSLYAVHNEVMMFSLAAYPGVPSGPAFTAFVTSLIVVVPLLLRVLLYRPGRRQT